jgi:antitoxin MazE
MNLQLAKWGNSVALRIPAEYLRQMGVKEGDQVEVNLTADGGLSIRPGKWNRAGFAAELAQAREQMPMGSSVIDELRRGARY